MGFIVFGSQKPHSLLRKTRESPLPEKVLSSASQSVSWGLSTWRKKEDRVGHGFCGGQGPRGKGGPCVVVTFSPALRKEWNVCPEEYLRLQRQGRGEGSWGRGREGARAVGLMESLNERPGRPSWGSFRGFSNMFCFVLFF